MAFVLDPTEEELQRALASTGAPNPVASGPAGGDLGGGGGPAGPLVPAGGAPSTAPGGDPQGTGFVNLSRYFDANRDGATAQAAKLIDPLKVDPAPAATAAAKSAANSIAEPAAAVYTDPNATTNAVEYNSNGELVNTVVGPTAAAEANAKAQSDYAAALAAHNKEMAAASTDAYSKTAKDIASKQMGKADALRDSPTKLSEAMSVDGQNPSLFDAYLTRAGMDAPYGALRDYYSTQTITPPSLTPIGNTPAVTVGKIDPPGTQYIDGLPATTPAVRTDRPPPPASYNQNRVRPSNTWTVDKVAQAKRNQRRYDA
jgi:hypothetical protein